MKEALVQTVYLAGGAVGFGGLALLAWTVIHNNWAPWDDDEASAGGEP